MSSCATNKFAVMSKSVGYRSVNILNKLPKYIVHSGKNEKQFIGKLNNLLLNPSFYCANEFLNYSYDL